MILFDKADLAGQSPDLLLLQGQSVRNGVNTDDLFLLEDSTSGLVLQNSSPPRQLGSNHRYRRIQVLYVDQPEEVVEEPVKQRRLLRYDDNVRKMLAKYRKK